MSILSSPTPAEELAALQRRIERLSRALQGALGIIDLKWGHSPISERQAELLVELRDTLKRDGAPTFRTRFTDWI